MEGVAMGGLWRETPVLVSTGGLSLPEQTTRKPFMKPPSPLLFTLTNTYTQAHAGVATHTHTMDPYTVLTLMYKL